MRLRQLLLPAYRVYTWAVVAACLAIAGALAILAALRPLEIAESSALLFAVAGLLVLAAAVTVLRRRLGAILVIAIAAGYALWLAAADAGGTALVVAALGAVVLAEAAALFWRRS